MWRSIMSSRFASWVVGRVSLPKERQLQHELDLQRLYILTQVHKATSHGRTANMHKLILESQALEPSSVRSEVEAALRQQVLATAAVLHEELVKAGDPAPAAARMADLHARAARRRERESSGLQKLIRRLAEHRQPPPPPLPTAAAAAASVQSAAAAEAQCTGNSSGSGGGGGGAAGGAAGGASGAGGVAAASAGSSARQPAAPELSLDAVSEALRRRLGFSLELAPSSVAHPEAGTGLFLRGEARPGSVVAVFPGVLYGRTQLAHMPNFPRVDTDNPYLSCRYDQSIVDSKPWGTGDPGPDPGPAPAPAPISGAGHAVGVTAPGAGAAAAERAGAVGGGPGRRWWRWAGPLSASLGLLEGRHPLALAHYVNHPGRGQSPNVLEASLDLPLDHPDLDLASRPWIRAYLPVVQPPLDYDPYGDPDSDEDDDDDDEIDDESAPGDKGAAASGHVGHVSGQWQVGGGGERRRRREALPPGELRPAQLLTPPGGVVRLLVLVATRAVRDGEELLQNYRMNPHVTRPDWYVVHDAEAEQRRWAKIRALDLGFKGSTAKPPPASAAAEAAPPNGSGGGGGKAAGG